MIFKDCPCLFWKGSDKRYEISQIQATDLLSLKKWGIVTATKVRWSGRCIEMTDGSVFTAFVGYKNEEPITSHQRSSDSSPVRAFFKQG
jgi:hypothetical protein